MQFIIWVLSDIQPKTDDQMNNFPVAVNDIVKNVGRLDMAITAGDIPEFNKSGHLYDWYLETRKPVQTAAWFEIAGNHDLKNLKSYQEKINPDLYYAVRAGNILFIFLSNSEKGSATVIPDDVVRWWKELVINNQDKIIITVSHATLKHSGLIQSRLKIKRLYIRDSGRFEKVMKKYRVDIWISGHSHLPGYLPYTDNKCDELNGTVFMDTGAIRKDFMTDVESRILIFTRGSNIFTIKHRLHEEESYAESRERQYVLPFPFIINEMEKPEIIARYKKSSL